MSTNQRMEIQAVLAAVSTLDGPVDVVSDSTYVVNCFRDRWWEGWLARGWKTSARKDVANRDLWEPLIARYRADPQRLRFRWVKGHSDDVMNDLVDRLAVEAARTQAPGAGDLPPVELPDADDVRGASRGGLDARLPPGRKVVVAGDKPVHLGGWAVAGNEVAASVRAKVAEILDAKRALHPDLVVLTGLGLGAEQLGAEAAGAVGVPYVVALPYPDAESKWPRPSQERFRSLLAGATDVVLLDGRAPATKQAAGGALARRDAWLARNADEAIVVWNGVDDFVGRLVRSLRDHVGEEEVWVVEP
jgi:ribonuclease HI